MVRTWCEHGADTVGSAGRVSAGFGLGVWWDVLQGSSWVSETSLGPDPKDLMGDTLAGPFLCCSKVHSSVEGQQPLPPVLT
ncbi:unnamed protein product [Boreogadus saida]